jgi:hypothetical protein
MSEQFVQTESCIEGHGDDVVFKAGILLPGFNRLSLVNQKLWYHDHVVNKKEERHMDSINKYQATEQVEVLFGSKSAAWVLLYIQSYGSGYGAQIADVFSQPINAVQQQLRKFETNGILVSYPVGKTRVFEFNPRGATVRNLKTFLRSELDFLSSEASNMPSEVYRHYFRQRTRPRRSGKPPDLVPERLRAS